MVFESLNLNNPPEQPEKKKTSAELARDHINLELETAEDEFQESDFAGRIQEGMGIGSWVIAGTISVFLFWEQMTGGLGQEFRDAVQGLDLQRFISTPEGKILLFVAVNSIAGSANIIRGRHVVREAIEKFKERKNHILMQYLDRIPTPPQP